MNTQLSAFTLATGICLLLACRKGDNAPCAEPICTQDARSVDVLLVNPSGGQAVLDSVQTLDKRGRPLRIASGEPAYGMRPRIWNGDAAATVVNDGWVEGNEGEEMEVTFRGFRRSTVVFEEKFTISADCCHVYKEEGPDQITVPN